MQENVDNVAKSVLHAQLLKATSPAAVFSQASTLIRHVEALIEQIEIHVPPEVTPTPELQELQNAAVSFVESAYK